MEVAVGVGRAIVVDDDVDTLDVNTTTKDVSGDEDTAVELLESLVALDSNKWKRVQTPNVGME